MVIAPSGGTWVVTRPSMSSVGSTSYRGDRRYPTRAARPPLSLPCSTVRTCRAPRNITPSEGLAQKEDGVAVLGSSGPPRIEAVERNVAGQLAMQRGEVGSV